MKKYGGGFSRSERVGQQLHEVLAKLLLVEVEDPRLSRVQITDVDLSHDLRHAKVYYVMLDGEEPDKNVLQAIDSVSGFLRSRLGAELQLQYVPELDIRFDEAVLKGRRIDELLDGLKEE